MAANRKASAGLLLLVAAALLLSACGLGPGEDRGEARLLVTRDYGREVIVDRPAVPLDAASTAMRVLDDAADLETAYGGGFVQSVNGIAGGGDRGRSLDWFYSVNGVVAERGSAEFPLKGGDTVWWDYRDWTDAMAVGAVVGAYPAPLSTGYDDRDWPVRVECPVEIRACGMVDIQLEGDGVKPDVSGSGSEAIRVIVATWPELSRLPEGRRLQGGPSASGVFARFGPDGLTGLDVRGEPGRDFGSGAGLVAAMRRGDSPPVWIVTGGSTGGVEQAAAALNPEDLARRYAAVVFDGRVGSLPWGGGGG